MHNQRGYGMELDIHYKASDKVDLLSNVAWQRSKNRDTLEAIHDAPGHQASVGLRVQTASSCSINAMLNWVADRKREASDTRDQVDDYTTVNLNSRCNQIAHTNLDVSVGIRNIFDEDAREPSPYNTDIGSSSVPNDYPQEGRSFYMELSYKL